MEACKIEYNVSVEANLDCIVYDIISCNNSMVLDQNCNVLGKDRHRRKAHCEI